MVVPLQQAHYELVDSMVQATWQPWSALMTSSASLTDCSSLRLDSGSPEESSQAVFPCPIPVPEMATWAQVWASEHPLRTMAP